MKKRDEIKKIVNRSKHKTEEQKMSNDFAVAFHIYETTELKKELTYLGKIVQEMNLDKHIIDRNIDKLFDLGLLCGDWNKIDGRWLRTYKIHPDALLLVEKVYCNYFGIDRNELSNIKESKNIEEINNKKQANIGTIKQEKLTTEERSFGEK